MERADVQREKIPAAAKAFSLVHKGMATTALPIGSFEPMESETRALGTDWTFSKSLSPEHQRQYIGGYKRDKLINVLSALVRPGIGGSVDARINNDEINKIVGRFIHVTQISHRLEGFNAFRQLKYVLNRDKDIYKFARERMLLFGWNGRGAFPKIEVTGKPHPDSHQQWKFGEGISVGSEIRREAERLLVYMYQGERIEDPIDIVPPKNKYVCYMDASLDTLAIFFCSPELRYGFYMDVNEYFRGWHISALELLCLLWALLTFGKHMRVSMKRHGPALLVPYSDNSSVPLITHKTWARSFGMELVMDGVRSVCRDYNLDLQLVLNRVLLDWLPV